MKRGWAKEEQRITKGYFLSSCICFLLILQTGSISCARETAAPSRIGGCTPSSCKEQKSLKDLPLIELYARRPSTEILAVILSGDGGWVLLVKRIGKHLAVHGIDTVGWSSLRYFRKERTPDEASTDLGRVLRHYLKVWGKRQVVLIGYSRGADILPFMAGRLPPELLDRVVMLALIGPELTMDPKIHLRDMLGLGEKENGLPVLPEIERLKGRKILCIHGSEEHGSLCPGLPPGLAQVVELKGGHHFDGQYDLIAEEILNAVETLSSCR